MEIKGKRFLLTGGASLIGSHVTERLLAGGATSVVLFDNYSLGSPELAAAMGRDKRVSVVRGDILRPNELYDALDGVDGVFALAAFLTLPLSQNPMLGMDVNVRGMMNVLEACRYRGVKKVVFSSSVATFGEPDVPDVDEDTPFRWQKSQPATTLYGATKIIGECLGRLYKQRYGIDFVGLRYSTVYGERQHLRGINAIYIVEAYEAIKAGMRPVLPGDGTQAYDYVYAGDVARANLMAMGSAVTEESFIIATGVDTSLNEVVKILGRLTNRNVEPEYRTDPSKPRTAMKPKLGYSPAKAERLLGWKPEVSIEEGIRRLIKWTEETRT
ncbi:MAG TPA: NAD-dependent epimerase/dehydratase family protein [Candidatus Sulfotelmatobacter sp.]|nr:NAD-dependent epimerase/dehydratase family protein [Candidatus Sulfotelmatobacter sp.]